MRHSLSTLGRPATPQAPGRMPRPRCPGAETVLFRGDDPQDPQDLPPEASEAPATEADR
jgi:hypothetical protein